MESTVFKRRPLGLSAKAKDQVITVISLICLFLFALSAYDKIIDHERFLKGVSRVKYIGAYAWLIAVAVPVAEILICGFLSVPSFRKLGLYGFAALMSIFTLYIAVMLLWAEKLPCHCNLIVETLSFGQHLVFNLAFIGLAVFALWLNKKHKF